MHLAARPVLHCPPPARRPGCSTDGAVLLEVILALVLFVGAAAILSSGLSSSLDALERMRLNTHAADLAVSVFSELQLGIKSIGGGGPQPFDSGSDLDGWTWEVQTTSLENAMETTNAFERVEVVIRHDDPELVYRLDEVLPHWQVAGGNTNSLPGIDSF